FSNEKPDSARSSLRQHKRAPHPAGFALRERVFFEVNIPFSQRSPRAPDGGAQVSRSLHARSLRGQESPTRRKPQILSRPGEGSQEAVRTEVGRARRWLAAQEHPAHHPDGGSVALAGEPAGCGES